MAARALADSGVAPMKVAVLGAGAVGCTFGYLLTTGGHDVVLIDVWEEHVDAINRDGLAVESNDGLAEHTRIAATIDASEARDANVVMVLVKSYSTTLAAQSVTDVVGPDTIIVTVQNGIGNDDALAEVLGRNSIVQGSTTVGCEMQGPGRVRISPATLNGGSITHLARPASQAHAETCRRFADALIESSLPTVTLDDVREVVWQKVALAAAVGPLCAVLRATIADVVARPPAMKVLRRAFEEIVAVAVAEGIGLQLEDLWTTATKAYESIGPHPPSLAVDVASGRRTEIDSQLGEVTRRGAALGVATLTSDTLVALVKALAPA